MPATELDSRIPLSVRPPERVDVLRPLNTLMKAHMLDRQEADERAQREAITEAFKTNTGPDGQPDYDKVVAHLAPRYPKVALDLQEQVAKGRKARAEADKAALDVKMQRTTRAAQMLQGALDNPSLYPAAYQQVQAEDPEMAAWLGETPDPTKIQQAVVGGMSTADYYKQQQDAIDLELSGKVEEAVGRTASLAKNNPEAWTSALAIARRHGRNDIVAMLGDTPTDEGIAKATQMGMSNKERADVENQRRDDERAATAAAEKATQDEAARTHQAAVDAREDKRLNEQLRIAQENLKLAQRREARLAASGDSGGSDLVAKRQAELWRANQRADLTKRKRGVFDAYGTQVQPPLTADDVKAEEDRIESSYRDMLGLSPKPEPEKTYGPAPMQSPAGAERGTPPRKTVVSPLVGTTRTLKDGRKIRIKAVDETSGQITDYDVLSN